MSTDFKEYSAAFHDHQNSLMHYGIPGMKWHKRKAGLKFMQRPDSPRRLGAGYMESKESDILNRLDAKMARKLDKLSNSQLRRISNNETAENDRSRHVPSGHGTYYENNTANIANNVLKERKESGRKPVKGSSMSDIVKKSKEQTGFKTAASVVAKSAARKEEKRRNKKLHEARKAERAYRRGGR
jgi:hypothetical protein